MAQTYAPLGKRFRFNEQLLTRVLDGMTDDHLGKTFADTGNSGHWILAHLVMARRGAARLAGARIEREEWEAAFGPGTDAKAAVSVMPDVAVLREAFAATGTALDEHLRAMTEEMAEAESPMPMPDGSKTVGDCIHFLYFHESYHLGQLGYIRRLVGLDRFA